MTSLIIGFTIGFLGSWHCVGMCGPLALALPYGNSGPAQRFVKLSIYSVGRIITYILIGTLLANVGSRLSVIGLQQALSIALGAIIIFLLVVPSIYRRIAVKMEQTRFISWVKGAIRKQFAEKGIRSFFVAGVLNGFLPCGMVYMAAVSALATADSIMGASLMLGFGLGTWPTLSLVALFSNLPVLRSVSIEKWASPVMMVFAGLLIWRGLGAEFPDLPQLGQFNPKSLTICR